MKTVYRIAHKFNPFDGPFTSTKLCEHQVEVGLYDRIKASTHPVILYDFDRFAEDERQFECGRDVVVVEEAELLLWWFFPETIKKLEQHDYVIWEFVVPVYAVRGTTSETQSAIAIDDLNDASGRIIEFEKIFPRFQK